MRPTPKRKSEVDQFVLENETSQLSLLCKSNLFTSTEKDGFAALIYPFQNSNEQIHIFP